VWDLDAGAPLVEPLEAHENFVNAVALGELGGRPIAVSGATTRLYGCGIWALVARWVSPWRAMATGSPRVDLEELRDAVSAELRHPVS